MNRKKISTCLLFLSMAVCATAQNITHPGVFCPGGLTVNSYSGNMDLQRTDLMLTGRMPIDITFTYKSADYKIDRGYGKGWAFSYGMKVEEKHDSVLVVRSNGRKDLFTPGTGNFLKSPAGNFDSLIRISAGVYQLHTRDGYHYYFENATHKRVTKQQDRNGNTLMFSYADSLISTVTGSGRTVRLNYHNGRLSRILEENGIPTRSLTYNYDNAGNLLKVTDPMGYNTEYKYAVYGPMNVVKDKNGNAVDIIYNQNLAVKEVISCLTKHSFIYSVATNTTHVTELVGTTNQLTNFIFNADGDLVRKTGNCCGYNVTYEYDEYKNVRKVTDANGNISTYTYDTRGNMLSMTDALGNTSYYTYEPVFGQLASYKNRNGQIIRFSHDSRGNLLQATYPLGIVNSFTYTANGDLASSTDGNGNVTRFSYDAAGHLTQMNKPLGAVYKVSYDEKGRIISHADPKNNTTVYTYDNLDRILSRTDAANKKAVFTYDQNGNRLSKTDRNNHKSTYEYDALDRPIKYTDALDHSIVTSYDAKGNVVAVKDQNNNSVSFWYDNLNRLVSEANQMNEITSYSYDNNGNRVSITLPNGNTITTTYDKLNRKMSLNDELGKLYTFGYDNLGNVTSVANGNGNIKHYTYDALDRCISFTNALGYSEKLTYDKAYNVTAVVDFDNSTWKNSFDSLNRRIGYTDPLDRFNRFEYDAADNLTAVIDARNNTTAYTYNQLNLVTQILFADGTTNNAQYDAEESITRLIKGSGAPVDFQYDAADRMTKKIFPGNKTNVFTYDPAGQMLSAINENAVVNLTYDASGKLLSESLNGKATLYSYNGTQDKRTTTYPGGKSITHTLDGRYRSKEIAEGTDLVATYSYDESNRLISQLYTKTGVNTTFDYDADDRMTSMFANAGIISSNYTYDRSGNLLLEKKANRPDRSEQFQYDKALRLVRFKSGTATGDNIPSPVFDQQISYDEVGNRNSVSENGQVNTYTTNTVNEYTAINGNSHMSFQYDGDGNMTNDGIASYTYDGENRMTAASVGNTEYKYDALGRRVQKKAGAGVINYYYSGMDEIEQRNAQDAVQSSFIFGTSLDEVISSETGGVNRYYHKNGLGSVMAVSDAAGNVMERYEYDPFGKTTFFDKDYTPKPATAINNNILFTGRTYDAEIGKYYFRARHLEETTGRFDQRDPLGFFAGDINLYSYVKNRPTMYNDPFGTDCQRPRPGISVPDKLKLGLSLADITVDDAYGLADKGSRAQGILGKAGDHLKGLGLISSFSDMVEAKYAYRKNPTDGKWVDKVMSGVGAMLALGAASVSAPVVLPYLAAAYLGYEIVNLLSKRYTGLSYGELMLDLDNECP
jgi:RHS repeat-associated protein